MTAITARARVAIETTGDADAAIDALLAVISRPPWQQWQIDGDIELGGNGQMWQARVDLTRPVDTSQPDDDADRDAGYR